MKNEIICTNSNKKNIDNFIQFIRKIEVSYAFYGITHDSDSSYPNTKDNDTVKCSLMFNNYLFNAYSTRMDSMFDDIVNEIIFNIKKLTNNYFYAFQYLNDIYTKILSLSRDFETSFLENKFDFDCSNNEFIDVTPKPKFNHRGKYNYMIECKISGFITLTKDYINKILILINQSYGFINDFNFAKEFKENVTYFSDNTIKQIKNVSFKYRGDLSTPAFRSFFEKLCTYNFMEKRNTELTNFRSVFLEELIQTKIIWIGGVLSLKYLILTLKEKELISYPKNDQLKIVKDCFKLNGDKIIKKVTFNSSASVCEKTKNILNEAIKELINDPNRIK